MPSLSISAFKWMKQKESINTKCKYKNTHVIEQLQYYLFELLSTVSCYAPFLYSSIYSTFHFLFYFLLLIFIFDRMFKIILLLRHRLNSQLSSFNYCIRLLPFSPCNTPSHGGKITLNIEYVSYYDWGRLKVHNSVCIFAIWTRSLEL